MFTRRYSPLNHLTIIWLQILLVAGLIETQLFKDVVMDFTQQKGGFNMIYPSKPKY
jgi:hypothetical protein